MTQTKIKVIFVLIIYNYVVHRVKSLVIFYFVRQQFVLWLSDTRWVQESERIQTQLRRQSGQIACDHLVGTEPVCVHSRFNGLEGARICHSCQESGYRCLVSGFEELSSEYYVFRKYWNVWYKYKHGISMYLYLLNMSITFHYAKINLTTITS